jgi:hypothetical protein
MTEMWQTFKSFTVSGGTQTTEPPAVARRNLENFGLDGLENEKARRNSNRFKGT